MTARYKRLILGLIVFLALMLMIGRCQIDTSREPPLSAQEKAQQTEQHRREVAANELRRNQYLNDSKAHTLCNAPETAPALQALRQHYEVITKAIDFADARDSYSLNPLDDVADTLHAHEPPECLRKAHDALLYAINNAKRLLVANADSDINVFDLRAMMHETMRYNLKEAEAEFALVDEALLHH